MYSDAILPHNDGGFIYFLPILTGGARRSLRSKSGVYPVLVPVPCTLFLPQSDMKEVQNMYRAQYNELLSRASMGASPS